MSFPLWKQGVIDQLYLPYIDWGEDHYYQSKVCGFSSHGNKFLSLASERYGQLDIVIGQFAHSFRKPLQLIY